MDRKSIRRVRDSLEDPLGSDMNKMRIDLNQNTDAILERLKT
jgi:hypothetical protein